LTGALKPDLAKEGNYVGSAPLARLCSPFVALRHQSSAGVLSPAQKHPVIDWRCGVAKVPFSGIPNRPQR
jgi:hypothetical protein